jgi:hypothetical protein
MRIGQLVLLAGAVAILGCVAARDAIAAPLRPAPLATEAADPLLLEVRRRFGGRGRVYVGPRFARPAYIWRPRHPYVIGPGHRVARPWWRPGTAVAAGAALGFVAAASAVAWAGQPPAPGYCWFYTDPSYHGGFWDVCPL